MAQIPQSGGFGGSETPLEPALDAPIDSSSSGLAVAFRSVALQIIVAAGAIITFLGLPDTSLVVKSYRLVSSEAFIPVLGLVSGALASGVMLVRQIRKHRQLQTLASLPVIPDTVAIGPSNPTVAVERAIVAATVAIDAEGALPAAFSPYSSESLAPGVLPKTRNLLHRVPPPIRKG